MRQKLLDFLKLSTTPHSTTFQEAAVRLLSATTACKMFDALLGRDLPPNWCCSGRG